MVFTIIILYIVSLILSIIQLANVEYQFLKFPNAIPRRSLSKSGWGGRWLIPVGGNFEIKSFQIRNSKFSHDNVVRALVLHYYLIYCQSNIINNTISKYRILPSSISRCNTKKIFQEINTAQTALPWR